MRCGWMEIYKGKNTKPGELKGKHLLYLFEIRLYSLHTGERSKDSFMQNGGI